MTKVADFFVEKTGDGLRMTLVIAGTVAPATADLEQVDGVQALIDRNIKKPFAAWLKAQQIDDAAKALGVGRSTAFRLKKALGLSEQYDGSSRQTKWREAKRKAAEQTE
jgi:hypothetical protein